MSRVKFVVATPVVGKKAARHPFKEDKFETLLELAAHGDTGPLDELVLTGRDFSDLDSRWRENDAAEHAPLPLFQSYLNDKVKTLLVAFKTKNFDMPMVGLPPMLSPSVLESYGYKFPVEAISSLTVMDLLDDYYGFCYSPSRIDRYTGDPLAAFQEAIRAKLNPSKMIEESSDQRGYQSSAREVRNGEGEDALKKFISLWGLGTVRSWWRGLDEDELTDFKESENMANLYHELVENFGGGLLEEETPELSTQEPVGVPEGLEPAPVVPTVPMPNDIPGELS